MLHECQPVPYFFNLQPLQMAQMLVVERLPFFISTLTLTRLAFSFPLPSARRVLLSDPCLTLHARS